MRVLEFGGRFITLAITDARNGFAGREEPSVFTVRGNRRFGIIRPAIVTERPVSLVCRRPRAVNRCLNFEELVSTEFHEHIYFRVGITSRTVPARQISHVMFYSVKRERYTPVRNSRGKRSRRRIDKPVKYLRAYRGNASRDKQNERNKEKLAKIRNGNGRSRRKSRRNRATTTCSS